MIFINLKCFVVAAEPFSIVRLEGEDNPNHLQRSKCKQNGENLVYNLVSKNIIVLVSGANPIEEMLEISKFLNSVDLKLDQNQQYDFKKIENFMQ